MNIAIYGGHGDAPRIVLAPTSVRDCMFTGEWAVHLAESLQTPVIVLSDQASAKPTPSLTRRPIGRSRSRGVPAGAMGRSSATPSGRSR